MTLAQAKLTCSWLQGKSRGKQRALIARWRPRLNKKNAGLLLNGDGDLVTADADEAEGLNAFFAFIFTEKLAGTLPCVRERVQGGGEHVLAGTS